MDRNKPVHLHVTMNGTNIKTFSQGTAFANRNTSCKHRPGARPEAIETMLGPESIAPNRKVVRQRLVGMVMHGTNETWDQVENTTDLSNSKTSSATTIETSVGER